MDTMQLLKLMAWERAKAELNIILQSFTTGDSDRTRYPRYEKAMTDFIKKIEDEGLQE